LPATGLVGTVSKELQEFLNRPTNDQQTTEEPYPIVMMDTRLVASPMPAPNLTIVIMIFARQVKGYCSEKFGGIPHSSRRNGERNRVSTATIHGCKTPLLTHQQEGLKFILDLESPTSTNLNDFRNSATCEWLRNSYHRFATLVICPLSTLANWEAEIHKHLDLNNMKYTIYHGEARKKLTGHMLWDYDIVIVTYDTEHGLGQYWMKHSGLMKHEVHLYDLLTGLLMKTLCGIASFMTQ
ncbi:hypothetical protein VP01_8044g1, partial [Puccinia sorghi]